jgi:hypothetical protein
MLSQHPANLLLRRALEVVGLISIAQWGWERSTSWPRIVFAIGLPLLLVALWMTFATPDEPGWSKRVLIPVPGRLRLLLEIASFSLTIWFMLDSNQTALAIAFGLALLLHLIWSSPRLIWLSKN